MTAEESQKLTTLIETVKNLKEAMETGFQHSKEDREDIKLDMKEGFKELKKKLNTQYVTKESHQNLEAKVDSIQSSVQRMTLSIIGFLIWAGQQFVQAVIKLVFK